MLRRDYMTWKPKGIEPYYEDDSIFLIHGDCLDALMYLSSNSIDSIVTDPPYGLSFMGKRWDYDVPRVEIWIECLRVLKPGGYLLSFAGTRTQHRMACNIEDAGFEIRDMIAWVYGSGFPKSLDVSKAIDKAAGKTPIDTGIPTARHNSYSTGSGVTIGHQKGIPNVTAPATDARKWEGWGTALKPALEPITVARKPLSEKTVAKNVLRYGTGGINIDGCRVESDMGKANSTLNPQSPLGRFPANFIHDGSEDVMKLFPNTQSGKMKKGTIRKNTDYAQCKTGLSHIIENETIGDKGSASRFFYCAKTSKKDREEGLEGLEVKDLGQSGGAQQALKNGASDYQTGENISCGLNVIKKYRNTHPTVKPTDLMQYLCRLVTLKKGIVLDPFMGSGSTGKACMKENFNFIGIEREDNYIEIAQCRIQSITNELLQEVFDF